MTAYLIRSTQLVEEGLSIPHGNSQGHILGSAQKPQGRRRGLQGGGGSARAALLSTLRHQTSCWRPGAVFATVKFVAHSPTDVAGSSCRARSWRDTGFTYSE